MRNWEWTLNPWKSQDENLVNRVNSLLIIGVGLIMLVSPPYSVQLGFTYLFAMKYLVAGACVGFGIVFWPSKKITKGRRIRLDD